MKCPKCNGTTAVRDSRDKADGTRRRRWCLSCGHRFTTLELDISEIAALSAAANANANARGVRPLDRETIRRVIVQLNGLIG